MRSFFLTSVLMLWCGALYGQSPVYTLQACRDSANSNAGEGRLYEILSDDLSENNLLTNRPFLPTLSGYASASYQSDTPNLANMTDFPFDLYSPSKLQYHSGLMLSQIIYSGGKKKLLSELNGVENEIEKLDLESYFIELDNKVDEVYLGIILNQKQSDIVQKQLETLQIKLKDAKNAFEEGHVYKNDILSAEAGILTVESKLAAYASERESLLKALSELTGMEIDDNATLLIPTEAYAEGEVNDPALKLIDLESSRLSLNKRIARSDALPNVSAFGTFGYGQWPLNMFRRTPDAYGIVGVSVVIPISGWQDYKYQSALLDNADEKLRFRREALEKQQAAERLRLEGEIAKYDDLVSSCDRIIDKYTELCDELQSLSDQGMVSMSDYFTALETLSSAKIDKELYTLLKLQKQLQRSNHIIKVQ
ncbi:MAG: TolC family protein [Bacteroidales bacterium]|nr:TolC family protein [Bacteroidales bacterium]